MEKSSDKIKHPLVIKALRQLRLEPDKGSCKKSAAEIMLTQERLEALALRLGMKQACPLAHPCSTLGWRPWSEQQRRNRQQKAQGLGRKQQVTSAHKGQDGLSRKPKSLIKSYQT